MNLLDRWLPWRLRKRLSETSECLGRTKAERDICRDRMYEMQSNYTAWAATAYKEVLPVKLEPRKSWTFVEGRSTCEIEYDVCLRMERIGWSQVIALSPVLPPELVAKRFAEKCAKSVDRHILERWQHQSALLREAA